MNKLTIIVLHHLEENKPFLDQALKSIGGQNLTNTAVHIICDTYKHTERWPWHYRPELNTFAKKVNWAIKEFPAQNYLIVSDDVILGDRSVEAMLNTAYLVPSIVNCDSNCEDVAFINPGLGSGVHIVVPTRIKFYCTLIPQYVVEKVGLLDENYVNGWEDVDYCVRCRKEKIVPVVTTAGFVYHHGGKTVDKVPKSADNETYYLKKWEKTHLKFIAYL